MLVPAEGFDDRRRLDDPQRPVEVRFLGWANRDVDAVACLPQQKMMLSGNILVSPIPYGFRSYPTDGEGTLAAVKAFDFKMLVPGHGMAMKDATYLDRLSALIARTRTKVAPMVAQGLLLDDVQKQIDLSEQVPLFARGDAFRMGVFDQYCWQPFVAGVF